MYDENNTSKAVEVPTDVTARDICQLFVLKNHCIDDHSWTLIDHLTQLGIGKIFFASLIIWRGIVPSESTIIYKEMTWSLI